MFCENAKEELMLSMFFTVKDWRNSILKLRTVKRR
jgi:hypothetical protein